MLYKIDIEKLETNIYKKEIIIDDIVGISGKNGTLYDNKSWKEQVIDDLKKRKRNSDFGYQFRSINLNKWENHLNLNCPEQKFIEALLNSGNLELVKYRSKFYIKDGCHRMTFAKILRINIPYFQKRKVYDLDHYFNENNIQ